MILKKGLIYSMGAALVASVPTALVVALDANPTAVISEAERPKLLNLVEVNSDGSGSLDLNETQSGWHTTLVESKSNSQLDTVNPGEEYKLKFELDSNFLFSPLINMSNYFVQSKITPNIFYSNPTVWEPVASVLDSNIEIIYDLESNSRTLPTLLGWDIKAYENGTKIAKTTFKSGDLYDLQFNLKKGFTLPSDIDSSFSTISSTSSIYILKNLKVRKIAQTLEASSFEAKFNSENNKWELDSFDGWNSEFIDPTTDEEKTTFNDGEFYKIRFTLLNDFLLSNVSNKLVTLTENLVYETSELVLIKTSESFLESASKSAPQTQTRAIWSTAASIPGFQNAIYDSTSNIWYIPWVRGWNAYIVDVDSDDLITDFQLGASYRIKYTIMDHYAFSSAHPSLIESVPGAVYYSKNRILEHKAYNIPYNQYMLYNEELDTWELPESIEGWTSSIIDGRTLKPLEPENYSHGKIYRIKYTLKQYYSAPKEMPHWLLKINEGAYATDWIHFGKPATPIPANQVAVYDEETMKWVAPKLNSDMWNTWLLAPYSSPLRGAPIDDLATSEYSIYRIGYKLNEFEYYLEEENIAPNLVVRDFGIRFYTQNLHFSNQAAPITNNQVAYYHEDSETWKLPEVFGWELMLIDPVTGSEKAGDELERGKSYQIKYTILPGYEFTSADPGLTEEFENSVYISDQFILINDAISIPGGQIATYNKASSEWEVPILDGWEITIIDPISGLEIVDPQIGISYNLKYTLIPGYVFSSVDSTLVEITPNLSYKTDELFLIKEASQIDSEQTVTYNDDTNQWDIPSFEGWTTILIDSETDEELARIEVGIEYKIKYTLNQYYSFPIIYDLKFEAGENSYQLVDIHIFQKHASQIPLNQEVTWNLQTEMWELPESIEGWITSIVNVATWQEIPYSYIRPGIYYRLKYDLKENYIFPDNHPHLTKIISINNIPQDAYMTADQKLLKPAGAIPDGQSAIWNTVTKTFSVPVSEGWKISFVHYYNGNPLTPSQIKAQLFYKIKYELKENYEAVSIGDSVTEIGYRVYESLSRVFRGDSAAIIPNNFVLTGNLSGVNTDSLNFEGWDLTVYQSDWTLLADLNSLKAGDSYKIKYTLQENYSPTGVMPKNLMKENYYTWVNKFNIVHKYTARDLPSWIEASYNLYRGSIQFPRLEGWNVSAVNEGGVSQSSFGKKENYRLIFTLKENYIPGFIGSTIDTTTPGVWKTPLLTTPTKYYKKPLTVSSAELTVDLMGNIVIPKYTHYETYIINRTTREFIKDSHGLSTVKFGNINYSDDAFSGFSITQAENNEMTLVDGNVYEILAVPAIWVRDTSNQLTGTYFALPDNISWDSTWSTIRTQLISNFITRNGRYTRNIAQYRFTYSENS